MTKGIDLEAVGTISGVPVYEFDLDNLQAEDKPWRKPGEDITDYFNYGFSEDTWKQYCEKQRRLRMDNNGKISVHHTNVPAKPIKFEGTLTVVKVSRVVNICCIIALLY